MKLGAAQHWGEELWNHVQVVLGWEEDFSSVQEEKWQETLLQLPQGGMLLCPSIMKWVCHESRALMGKVTAGPAVCDQQG